MKKAANQPATESASFYFAHVRLRPDEQIGMHTQSSWELSCIVEGHGRRCLGERWAPFDSGDVVLVPPLMPHCWLFAGDGLIENVTVAFKPALLARMSAAFPELRPAVERVAGVKGALSFAGHEAAELRRLMLAMTEQSAAERVGTMVTVLARLSQGVGSASREAALDLATKAERRVREVETYVSCNYQRDVSIDVVARHVGMNRSAFCTFFRKATGHTFVGYLSRYRIEMACELLLSTEATVAEVCYRSGFRDVPHFNRVFRRLTGLSPSAYRQQRGG